MVFIHLDSLLIIKVYIFPIKIGAYGTNYFVIYFSKPPIIAWLHCSSDTLIVRNRNTVTEHSVCACMLARERTRVQKKKRVVGTLFSLPWGSVDMGSKSFLTFSLLLVERGFS